MAEAINWQTVRAKYDPEFVWLCHMPYNGAYARRMFPADEFSAMLEQNERATLAGAAVCTTRNFHVVQGGTPCGVLYLEPDWSSAYANPSATTRRIEVMASWVNELGVPVAECARSTLARLAREIHDEHGLTLLFGFEVEVVFRPGNDGASEEEMLSMVEEIVRALRKAGVPVKQFHAEVARHQWEFILGPGPPMEAVDLLVRARRVIGFVARAHGSQVTLHPRPVATEVGTGAHVHISATPITSTTTTSSPDAAAAAAAATPDSFFAGILQHIRALAAFTMPLDVSYDRVRPGIWSSGVYVCWGWQNREVPLRRISSNRFEIKTLCGTANPYVAMAALLAAGLDGMQRRLSFTTEDCQQDPSRLSDAEREALGIRDRLPVSIEESLKALEWDFTLCSIIGERLVTPYAAVTREWNDHLRTMDEHERHEFLLANY
ncbi:Protein fluG [Cladobotryum mycophilum]|uniref:Protein fluG n=1 Tax=Cladobotryum mycophilum TaxID=491253 RepID=A0ABR0SLC2_9HYPO